MKWIICLLFGSIVSSSGSSDLNRRLLNNILSDGMQNKSPCTDYYEYACGKYGERHINDSFVGIFQVLSHKVNTNLLQLMGEIEEQSKVMYFNESSLAGKVLRFYRNCREAPPETRTVEHYLRLAPPAEGLSWPPLTPPGTSWPADKFKWIETVAHLFHYDLSATLISIGFTQNDERNTEVLLSLERPYSNTILNIEEVQRALREMRMPSERIQNLGRTLRRLHWSVQTIAYNRNIGNRIMSIQEMNIETGYDWQKFIEIIVGHRIQLNFRVEVKNLSYLMAIRRLIDNADVELVAYYLMSRLFLRLQAYTEGGKDPLDCIKDVRRNMYLAANHLHKERFLDNLQVQSQEIERVFAQIRQQLILKIESNRLGLTVEQRMMADRKVKDLVLNIGNMPRFHEHWDFTNEYYEDLDVPSEDLDFAREHIRMLKFYVQKVLGQLRHSENEFFMPNTEESTISNPFLVGRQNVIVVPYDLLQEPFFEPDSDDVFKYSLMGFALARELMRSVDNTNIPFDTYGNLNKIGIDIANSPKFQEALQCATDSNELDMNEHLADIGGLNLAYSAYLASRNVRFNPSTKETFFRNLAQTFCTDGFPDANGQHVDQLHLEYMLKGYTPFDRALECLPAHLQCQFW